MIPVARVIEPKDFDHKVKEPGKRWLAENPSVKRPKALWEPYLATLSDGFSGLCGYAAMYDPTGGTVDHFLSFRNRPDLAYEWDNYRYASGPLNSSKRNADDAVLDPYEIGPGWFEIILPSLQMRATDKIPAALRAKAEYTLDRLKLRDGERIIRWRKSWYDMWRGNKLTLDGLRQMAPLLADAVAAQAAVPAAAPAE